MGDLICFVDCLLLLLLLLVVVVVVVVVIVIVVVVVKFRIPKYIRTVLFT